MIVNIVAVVRSVWRTLTQRSRAERALDDEVRAYVELLAVEYERAGLAPSDARRRAFVETGGIEQIKEATRDVWLGNGITNGARELRFALRSLRNAPVYSLVAVAILAIGIGGATAIFTVIKGSLLQPLPAVARPAELVSLEPTKGDALLYDFSYLDYRELRDETRSLSGLAGYDGTSMRVEDRWGPRTSVWVSYVTGNFFPVLGATPSIGRLIVPADEASGAPVVVLAYDFWQRHFGGDPRVVGATVDLAGHPVTVIGVARPRFIGAMLMHPMEMWIPLTALPGLANAPGLLDSHADTYLRLVGRLAAGRTITDARAEFSLLAARLAATYPSDAGHGIKVFAGAGMTDEERTALAKLPRLLAVAVWLLMLIACANVANLSLVRAATRRRELATRLALGASTRSLVARLLLEAGVLALAGTLLGTAVAQALVRSHAIADTVAGMPARVGLDVSVDQRVLAVTVAASVLTAIVVSILPVLHVLRLSPGAVLKDGATGAVRRRSRGQRSLVAVQIAASLVLLASAAVVFNAFRRVLNTDFGFDPRGLTAVIPDLREGLLDSAQVVAYRREWLARAATEPSIAAVAEASTIPPAAWARQRWVFRSGEEPPPGVKPGDVPSGGKRAYLDMVSAGFFDLMRIPIRFGRNFTSADDRGAQPVVIVSQQLAGELWPNEHPLGKMLSLAPVKGRRQPAMRVVGVAMDVPFASLFDRAPAVAYTPAAQHTEAVLEFIVRSRGGKAIADTTFRRLGALVDPRVSVYTNVVTDLIGEQLQPQHVASVWIGIFGAIALLLAAVGLYGVVAQAVLQRTREIAVRSALGATPGSLVSLVIGDGMRIAAFGAVAGVLGGAAALRVLESQFAGVSLIDVRAAGIAVAVLSLAMLVACYVPARRAARLNPVDALRAE